ncbi:MAG: DUF4440 domain-containing protein [Alphaproteobacteria bacterium]|nr:DUF4440 domain-containing protein [Alphaproteobacteria bacterium]
MKSKTSVVVLVFAAGLNACAPSTEADEAAIRAANKAWLAAIVAKDAKAIGAMHAEDAQMLPPNAPKAVGREAIEKGWESLMGLPGLALTFETEKFVFAKSADLAVDIGTYSMTAGGQTDTGKSVVTWTKRGGKWVVLTDMFSSDLPVAAPAAAPVVEAPAETPAAPPAP